jgi:hypothetical protein
MEPTSDTAGGEGCVRGCEGVCVCLGVGREKEREGGERDN